MQMLLETLDLTADDRYIQRYDFGAPRLSADAAAWDAAGNHPMGYPGDRHEDADVLLEVVIGGTDSADVESRVAEVLALCVPNAKITFTEGAASGSRYTFVRNWSEPRLTHNGTWAVLTLTGTRCPYWHGAQVDVAEAELVDGYGAQDVSSSGDVTALTRYYVTGPAGTEGIALAVRAADAGFDWESDETDTVTMTLADTWYEAVSRTVTDAAYADRFLVAVRCQNNADAVTRLRVAVTAAGVTETSVHSVCAKRDTAGYETVLIGPVTVPLVAYLTFPDTVIKVECSTDEAAATIDIDTMHLVPVPSGAGASAAIVHLDDTMCLDGLPESRPSVYAYNRANDTIGASTLAASTLFGWPMLRPGANTIHVLCSAETEGTGYISVSHVPRYLLPA